MLSFTRAYRRASRVLKPGLVMMTLSLLSACASMTEGECLTANWIDRGYMDGSQGYPASRVVDHRDACAEVGVIPDFTLYRRGYDQGIEQYCTPANALAEGRAGRYYGHVCPARLAARFLAYYRQGRAVYDAQQRVNQLNSQSRQLQRQLDDETGRDARRRLRNELRDLDRRLRQARNELAELDRALPYR